jgi:hypothetical protein
LLSFVPDKVNSFQHVHPTLLDDGPVSFVDIGRQFHEHPRYGGRNKYLKKPVQTCRFFNNSFLKFSVNEMLTAQLEIIVYFPCVRLAFHVSKCFIAVLRLQLTAGSDVLEQQTIVACVFLGKLI